MKINHFSKSVVGLVRAANEDCIASKINNSNAYSNVFVVCDGMGGYVGGAKASEIATKNIIEYFSKEPDLVPQNALKAAIEFANIQIFGTAQANPELRGMGTTCTILVENGGLIYIAHVGDSRIYIHSDNKLYRLTKDHSYVQGLVDAGIITDSQMENHPRKNELTKALGISEEVEIEVATQPIFAKKGDKFLLCTDGLCGLINDQQIENIINLKKSLDETVNNLIYLAEKSGGHDNISVDLIEVIDSVHSKSQFINKNNTNFGKTQTIEIPTKNKQKINLTNKLLTIALLIGLTLSSSIGYNLYNRQTNKPIINKPEPTIVIENDKENNKPIENEGGTTKFETPNNEDNNKKGKKGKKGNSLKDKNNIKDKDSIKDKVKEVIKAKDKDTSKDKDKKGKESSKEKDKDSPKESSKEKGKESSKEKDKESPKESSKEKEKETSKEKDKESPKESSKEKEKESSKEKEKDSQKEKGKEKEN